MSDLQDVPTARQPHREASTMVHKLRREAGTMARKVFAFLKGPKTEHQESTKRAPREHQESPRTNQNYPKKTQDHLKIAQDNPKMSS